MENNIIIVLLLLTLSHNLFASPGYPKVKNLTDNSHIKELSGNDGSEEFLKHDTNRETLGMKEESLFKGLIKETITGVMGQVEMLNAEVKRQNILIKELKDNVDVKGKIIDEMKSRIKDLEGSNIHCGQTSENSITKETVMDEIVKRLLPEKEIDKVITVIHPKTIMPTSNEMRSGNIDAVVLSRVDRNIGAREGASSQIAFNAYLTKEIKEQDLKQNLTLLFDNMLLNLGNGYNNRTGKFTAPVDGIYFFHFHTVSNMMGLAYAYLVKNGQQQVSSILNPPNFSYVGRNIEILSLMAGDSVWIEIMYDAPVEIKADTQLHTTSFSGFLLFQ